jgi:hypothetical protein
MTAKESRIEARLFPSESCIAKEIAIADFHDSYRLLTSVKKKVNPLEVYCLMVKKVPGWINFLLSLRNIIARLLGLKDVGNLGRINQFLIRNNKSLEGCELDFFTIAICSQNEMILILNDKHLDIKISILINEQFEEEEVIFSTLVKFNNFYGKVYMFIIAPFHKIIVKRLMRNIES